MIRAPIMVTGLALLLAACGQGGEGNSGNAAANDSTAAVSPSGDNLAKLLGDDPRFAGLVKAAGMSAVLEGKEPYTVLAPSKEALDALPAGTLERLQKPESRAELTALLRHHFLPGTILAADLSRAVQSGGGKASLASMAGDPLTVTAENGALRIADSNGGSARVVGAEQVASNGVVHRIDAVLPAPKANASETN